MNEDIKAEVALAIAHEWITSGGTPDEFLSSIHDVYLAIKDVSDKMENYPHERQADEGSQSRYVD
jgi:hypothetical protein